MRLPSDPENWTGHHAESALAKAWKEFDRYEAKINFDKPQAVQDEIYEPYRRAREEAVMVCTYTMWMHQEAGALP